MTPKYILDFIQAICPEAPKLFLAAFNEQHAIETATQLIVELRQRVAELEQERGAAAEAIEAAENLYSVYALCSRMDKPARLGEAARALREKIKALKQTREQQ